MKNQLNVCSRVFAVFLCFKVLQMITLSGLMPWKTTHASAIGSWS